MKPVVFLSHSSRDDERARALHRALVDGGRVATTFDVHDLRHGEEWGPQLHRWMARCQGGVLLVTQQVMDRHPWVLFEASYLRARSLLEGPDFKLFIVIDKPVLQHPVWLEHFAPLDLPAVQTFKLDDPGQSIAPVIAAIEAGMQPVADFGNDHLGRLAVQVFDALDPFLAEQGAAKAIAEKLTIADAWYVQIVKPLKALQGLCARRLAAGDLGKFQRLDFLFNAIAKAASAEARVRLFNVLRSHWVPLANASRLSDVIDRLHEPAPGETPANVVVLHTESTSRELVARLHDERRFQPYELTGRWFSLPPGTETEVAARDHLLGELRGHFQDPEFPLAELVDYIDDQRLQPDQPIHTFVHVGGAVTASYLLPVMRDFWPCVFVLTAAGTQAGAIAAELGTAPVHPPDPALERKLVHAINSARSFAVGS